jgi:nitrate reductase alpha subunit
LFAQQEKSRVSVPLITMTFRREDLKAWAYARKVHVFEKNAKTYLQCTLNKEKRKNITKAIGLKIVSLKVDSSLIAISTKQIFSEPLPGKTSKPAKIAKQGNILLYTYGNLGPGRWVVIYQKVGKKKIFLDG